MLSSLCAHGKAQTSLAQCRLLLQAATACSQPPAPAWLTAPGLPAYLTPCCCSSRRPTRPAPMPAARPPPPPQRRASRSQRGSSLRPTPCSRAAASWTARMTCVGARAGAAVGWGELACSLSSLGLKPGTGLVSAAAQPEAESPREGPVGGQGSSPQRLNPAAGLL